MEKPSSLFLKKFGINNGQISKKKEEDAGKIYLSMIENPPDLNNDNKKIKL